MAHSHKHRKAISEGLKRYHRSKGKKRHFSPSQRRALKKSRYSKSGHKSYKARLKSRKPGLWSYTWAKRKREGKWKPKRK